MGKFWQRLRCRLNWHSRLDVIQTFGSAQHIGCPHCGSQMGIHHGMQAVILWDSRLADMYQICGYDTDAATRKWQAYRRASGFVE